MKVVAKLLILLVVLTLCLPAHAEILIYSKTHHHWSCYEYDPGLFDCEDDVIRGFLVLDVEYYQGEIVAINNAEQIDYERDGQDKWYWQETHEDMYVERLLCDGDVVWVFEELDVDIEPDGATIWMVRGKRPRMVNIGLGKDEKREVVRQLNGDILGLWYGEGADKRMCTLTLRLHNRWTRLANDPDECDGSFECAVSGIVKEWLIQRGYDDGGQDNGDVDDGDIDDGDKDDGDQDDGDDDDSGDGNQGGIILI